MVKAWTGSQTVAKWAVLHGRARSLIHPEGKDPRVRFGVESRAAGSSVDTCTFSVATVATKAQSSKP